MNLSRQSAFIFHGLWILLLISGTAFAQRPDTPNPRAAACGVCSFFLLIPVIFFALHIAMLIWVARDAKARGMDNAVMWTILVLFIGVIGLFIYIFSRPRGNLVKCVSCGNSRLQASAICPQCGNI